jgi:chitodextrinase
VEISWTPADGLVQPQSAAKGIGTAAITGLSDGASYTFTLIAVDTSGNKSAGETGTAAPHAPDTTPPGGVSGLAGTAGNKWVSLSWTDPGDTDLDHLEITWTPAAIGVTQPVIVDKSAEGDRSNSKTITGLVNSTAYTFTVKAVDDSGNKNAGESSALTPLASLPGPLFVKPNGTGTKDGSSWANASGDIQAMIDLAA